MWLRATRLATYFIFLFAIGFSYPAQSQIKTKEKSESSSDFVSRVTRNENLAYPVVEYSGWDSSKTVLLAFIPTADEITVGLLFVPIDSFNYQQILIDSFSTQGNTARIDSVFFFNVDLDSAKELVVMASYDQSKAGKRAVVQWNLVFDNPNLTVLPTRFTYLEKPSGKIEGIKYTNVSTLRQILLDVGRE